jgi:hypothetical protein
MGHQAFPHEESIMRTSIRRTAAALAVLAAGLVFGAGPNSGTAADAKGAGVYKPVLPDDVFAKLVAEDAKVIKDSLAKASDKKMANKAKVAALMIAVYAQGAAGKPGAKAAELAGLRDEALKVAKAIDAGKVDEAKKKADDLKATGVSAVGAKSGPIAVHDGFDIDLVMQQFKPERGGGLELEKKLQTYVNKRSDYTAVDYQQMVPLLYRIAEIAQPTEALAPAPMGQKDPAKWVKWSQEMGTLAAEAAELAKKPKPDSKAVKAALKNLDANCTTCHTLFRD